MAGRVFVVFDRDPRAGASQPLSSPPSSEQHRLVQSGTGLNEALIEADAAVRKQWPGDHVAALVGDLPALRPEELQAALARAAEHPQAFVADASGEGTTLLTAAATARLAPAFGPRSAARHGLFAYFVPAGPGLRLDVDTAADLEQARALGLGPATAAVLDDIDAS
jgi:2-phospho-L-lactate guanylyltransferase